MNTKREFLPGATYSDKRGNKRKITGNDNVGCFPLLATTLSICSEPIIDEFTLAGGYQEDEPSDLDLVWQDQGHYAQVQFKNKCDLFNTIAGKDKVQSDFDLENQVKLVREEAQELFDAVTLGEPLVNILQETIDVLVVAQGMLQLLESLGCDTNGALLAVADKNLSKFTSDRDEAWESMEQYHKENKEVTVEYNRENNVYVLKDQNDKVRKPLKFTRVDLSKFVPKDVEFKV